MVSVKRGLFVLTGLVAVSFAVHYAMFGSLPLGKPQLLREDDGDAEAVEA